VTPPTPMDRRVLGDRMNPYLAQQNREENVKYKVGGEAGGTGINQRLDCAGGGAGRVKGGTHGDDGGQLIGPPELGANRQPCHQPERK
jgi:hypothetical protein